MKNAELISITQIYLFSELDQYMATFPPNPINSLGDKRDIKSDRAIAVRSRYLNPKSVNEDNRITHVYFVLASDNLVKIGRTKNLESRVGNLSVLHPAYKLLGTVTDMSESKVQKIFSDLKVKGEWFKYSDTMIDFIKLHNL
jgi:hypothetical protein